MKNNIYVLLRYGWDGDSFLSQQFAGIFTSINNVPEEIKTFQRRNKKEGDLENGFFTDDNISEAPKEEDGQYESDEFYVLKTVTLNCLVNYFYSTTI